MQITRSFVAPAAALLAFGLLGVSSGHAIVGGEASASGDWPWMVGILDADDADNFTAQYCGGAVIHPHWVVTSARCVVGAAPENMVVGYGSNQLTDLQRARVVDIVPHPLYDPETFENDIALLLLAEPLPASIPAVAINTDPDREAPGIDSLVLGWGVDGGGTFPVELRQTSLPIVSRETAEPVSGRPLPDTAIMAGLAEGGRDSCQGDLGGPLVVPGIDGVGWALAGVISFGPPGVACAAPLSYGGHTRLSAFFDWVQSFVRPAYLEWTQQNGVSGLSTDGDHDGFGLVEEYVHLGDVNAWSPELVPVPGETTVAVGRVHTLSFRWRSGIEEEFDWRLELSTDLANWTPLIDPVVVREPLPDKQPGALLTVRPAQPIEANSGLGYFRVGVRPARGVTPTRRQITTPGFAVSELSELSMVDSFGLFRKAEYEVLNPTIGTNFRVSVRSSEFPVLLSLRDADTGALIRAGSPDADGGGAGFEFTPEKGINYLIVISTSTPGGVGTYSLRIFDPDTTIVGSGTVSGTLSVTDEPDPLYLDVGIYYKDDFILLPGDEPQLVQIEMSSLAVDCWLIVIDAGTGEVLAENDDSAPGQTNSTVQFIAEPGRSYIIRASTAFEEEVGSYLLVVQYSPL